MCLVRFTGAVNVSEADIYLCMYVTQVTEDEDGPVSRSLPKVEYRL
jgi:hypothetical protein